MPKRPILSNDRLYVIATHYAQSHWYDNNFGSLKLHSARDFASYEWQKSKQYGYEFNFEKRVIFMKEMFWQFIVHVRGQKPRPKHKGKYRETYSKWNQIHAETIGLPKDSLTRYIYQFEDSKIYQIARFKEMIKSLSEFDQHIVILNYVWGYSTKEIAERLGSTTGRIDYQLSRIKHCLK